jgi:hypothetical protein
MEEFIIIGIVLVAGIVAIIFMLNSGQEDDLGVGLCSEGGGMSKEELRPYIRKFYPTLPAELVNIYMNALDSDGDNCVDSIDVYNFDRGDGPGYQAVIEYIQTHGLAK